MTTPIQPSIHPAARWAAVALAAAALLFAEAAAGAALLASML